MKRSITLIELMISVAVLSIILSFVFFVTGTGKVSWYISSAKVFLNRQARAAISRISNELLLSNPSRALILAENNLKFSIPLVNSNGDLALTDSGDLRWGDGEIEGNSINYTIKDQDLIRRILNANDVTVAGSEEVVARSLDSFSVVLDQLQYEITLRFRLSEYLDKAFPDPVTYSVNTAITPQN